MKTVKIFISSTFKDMNAERDVLIKWVFPKLREEAESKLGVRIQEVDLRWGITEEEARKGSIMDLCLSGIDECRPYFLCMLGKRYGWIPAPVAVNAEVMEAVFEKASDAEMEILRKAYGRSDEVVYTLDLKLSDNEKEAARAILEGYGVKEAGRSITEQEIEHVLDKDSVPKHIRQLDQFMKEHKEDISEEEEKYVLSYYIRAGSENVWYLKPGLKADEKIKLSHILSRIGAKIGYHTFFFVREDCGEEGADYIETKAEVGQKLEDLKNRIEEDKGQLDGYAYYKCQWVDKPIDGQPFIQGLDDFGKMVCKMLWEHIKNNPELRNTEKEKVGLELEEELQMKYVDGRTYNFRGRAEVLDNIKKTIGLAQNGKLLSQRAGKETGYILITGEPGSGKSAVMAKLYMELQKQYKEDDIIIIGRFVGATGRSTSPGNLLVDFCEIIKKKCKLEDDIPVDYNELKVVFAKFLGKANRRVILLIDAVNQLRGNSAASMSWLPKVLPEGVCILLSLAEDEKIGQKGGVDIPACEIRIKALTEEERTEISVSYLGQYNKKLAEEQIKSIITKKEAHLPLFLRVSLEELRMVSRYEELPEYFTNTLKDSTEEMFRQMLIRLENELEQTMPGRGKQLFIDFVKYIAAGRNGMTEQDLRLLLGDWHKIDNNKSLGELRIDDYHWGELKRSLRTVLFLSGGEWNFFHQQLKQAVGERYLEKEEDRKKMHMIIADYLEKMGYEHGTTAKDLPHHLKKADKTDELRNLLFTFKWMYEKLKATNVNELISDYDLLDEREIKRIKDAITLSAHIVSKDIRQLPTQIYGRLLSYKADHKIGMLLKEIRNWSEFVWIRPVNICLQQPGSTLLRTLAGHADEVYGVCITTDGKKAVSASNDRTLKVWDVETGEEIRTLTGHTAVVSGVSVIPGGSKAVSASLDKTLKVWDIDTGELIKTLYGHTEWIRGVSITADGKKAVSASWDNTLKVWDIETGKEIRTLTGHTDGVEGVSITPDGKKAVSASKDKTLKVWDLETGEEIRTLTGHTNWVRGVSITPNGKKAVSASSDKTLKLWDIETGEVIKTLYGHAGDVIGIGITCDGKKAVSASSDKTLKVWDVETGEEIRTLTGHTGGVTGVSITPDGRKGISGSWDKTLKIWDMEAEEGIRASTGHTGMVEEVCITSDGKKAVSASWDNTLKIWDTETGMEIKTLTGHHSFVNSAGITPDGKKVVSASRDRTLKVWDMETGKEIRTLTGHTNNVNPVCITPDGRKAVSAAEDKTLKIWDIETGRELVTLAGDNNTVSITPDGKKAVSSSGSRTFKVWDLETGREIKTLTGNADWVMGVRITPDGKKAVSASNDNTLKLWDLETGKEIWTLTSHTNSVTGVSITPDGKKAVSASRDNSLKLWEVETGRMLASFQAEEGLKGYNNCTVTSDGLIIVTGIFTHNLYFLKIEGENSSTARPMELGR
jgi:WD40 repeat protein